MANNMEKNRYVVYWEMKEIHHYFETYEKACNYVIKNGMSGARIAKLISYTLIRPIELIELGEEVTKND